MEKWGHFFGKVQDSSCMMMAKESNGVWRISQESPGFSMHDGQVPGNVKIFMNLVLGGSKDFMELTLQMIAKRP